MNGRIILPTRWVRKGLGSSNTHHTKPTKSICCLLWEHSTSWSAVLLSKLVGSILICRTEELGTAKAELTEREVRETELYRGLRMGRTLCTYRRCFLMPGWLSCGKGFFMIKIIDLGLWGGCSHSRVNLGNPILCTGKKMAFVVLPLGEKQGT